MAKAELKTKVNDASVTKFINSVAGEQKRNDCFEILKMMQQITKEEPKMWGSSMVGFGSYHYIRKKRARRRLDVDRFLAAQTKPDVVFDGRLRHSRRLAKETWQVHHQRGVFVYQDTGRC
jgi:hypothetical protein